MFGKLLFCAVLVSAFADIPADVKAKVEEKIGSLSPDGQKYAHKFLDAYVNGNGDHNTIISNIMAVKEELSSDPNAAIIKDELKSVVNNPSPPTDEQKQKINEIIKNLSPAAQAVSDQIGQVLQGSSDDKFEEIVHILNAVTDPALKAELDKAKNEIFAILPTPEVTV